MQNISGSGIQVQLVASSTFPGGLNLSQFADDADPFDLPSIQVADTSKGVNGDLLIWSKANPYKLTLNMIPGSEDDRNLQILLNANTPGVGKIPARDVITMVATYPDGTVLSLKKGGLTDGMPGNSVSSQSRLKSKSYAFAFEAISGNF